MPRKEFEAFTRLDASDVNSFLMDQTVMSFAGTAARGSAIPTPVEGMVSFLEDSNLMSIYEGGAWRPSLASLGGVLQVVTSTTSTQINITTNTFTDTTLTATITPKSVSSRIICFVNQNGVLKGNGDANNSTPVRIVFPNATTNNFGSGMGFTQTANFLSFSASFVASYTPNSTSAQTFKTQFASAINGQLSIVQDSGSSSSIVLMEVAS